MKPRIITAALLASLSLFVPTVVFSQPSETGSQEPGFWQPKGDVNINSPIRVTLINDTDIPIDYQVEQSAEQQLFGGSGVNLGTFNIDPSADSDLDRNLNILINSAIEYSNVQLHFDITTTGNQVTIRVRERLNGEVPDKGLYVDERGRIYVF